MVLNPDCHKVWIGSRTAVKEPYLQYGYLMWSHSILATYNDAPSTILIQMVHNRVD